MGQERCQTGSCIISRRYALSRTGSVKVDIRLTPGGEFKDLSDAEAVAPQTVLHWITRSAARSSSGRRRGHVGRKAGVDYTRRAGRRTLWRVRCVAAAFGNLGHELTK